MASFDSPLGKKKFSGPQMKKFDVPDEGDNFQSQLDSNEPVVRKRAASQINFDQIREFQAKMQREEMPIYERDPSDIEREIRQAKEDRRVGRERLSDGAKRRIEMLIGMTRSHREVDIDGNVFVLQSLKSKEMRDALMAASEFDGTVQSPFEIRKQLLARSISHIAGVEISAFLGSYDLDVRFTFIDELDESLLNRLYDEYLILSKEAREKFAIKTQEDAQEVMSDLKK